MFYQNIVVFDFETGGDNKFTTEITQIGAMALSPRTLLPFPGPDATFNSLMRPSDPYNEDLITEGALAITRLTRERLDNAPDPGEVWHKFAKWVARWSMGGKNDFYCSPIAAGHNINGFDMHIYERYCYKYKTLRKSRSGWMEPGIFNGYIRYDTMSELAMWFENLREPGKINLDFLRDYFGLPKESKENAHDALQDVKDTAWILAKIMEMKRMIAPNIRFKDCYNAIAVEPEKKKKAVKNLVEKAMS